MSPVSWLQFIVGHGLVYMLSGLSFDNKDQVGSVWREFWAKYRVLNQNFELFNRDFDPSSTIALYLHGDEGRTLKRGAIMVTSIQSVLGFGFNQKRLKRALGGYRLHVNFAGHTATTRFAIHTLPKVAYHSDPDVFHITMDHLADQMKYLFETGVRDSMSGTTFKFVLIGAKGDMPYLQKLGHLKRSWNTTVKRGLSRKEPAGVCRLAGTPRYPCEDTSHTPCWTPTIAVKLPWIETPGLLKKLLHDPTHPASFFKPDLWHCIHLGVGKSFIASTIQMALDLVPATNNEERFQWLTDHYVAWCRRVKTNTFVSKISAYLVAMDGTGATGNWSKGSLTRGLMRWLVALLTDLAPPPDSLLLVAKRAAKDLNDCLSFLYNCPLFLQANECKYVCSKGMSFLQIYSHLANKMYEEGRWQLYPLLPKSHAVHHIWHQLNEDSTTHGFGMNPLTASCQQDEDCVGRLSRLSRRVNIKTVMARTLERHRMNCFKVWKDNRLLV